MKKFDLMLLATMLVCGMSFTGCDNDDNTIDGCDKEECELLQEIGARMRIKYEGNPNSWHGVTWTAVNPSEGTRHVTSLVLDTKEERQIPALICDFPYLRKLEVRGEVIGGVPRRLCLNQTLDSLIIIDSKINALDGHIFHSGMKYVEITGNLRIGILPESIHELKGNDVPVRYNLSGNWLEGELPAIEGVNIDLSNNNFYRLDFANAFNATQSTKESGKKEVYGVHMAGNNFSHLVIPENVLSDTLALIHLAVLNQPIDYSKTFSNMPSQAELKALAEKYYRNHPDLADLSSLFD